MWSTSTATWFVVIAQGPLLLYGGGGGLGETTTARPPLDVPFFQQAPNGCGAASVAMVMHYWGAQQMLHPVSGEAAALPLPTPEEIYQKLYRPEREGIRLADMRHYLEEAGFHAFTLRGQWADLEKHLAKGRPLIVGIRKEAAAASLSGTQPQQPRMHFVVLTGARGDFVWLNDPTRKKPTRIGQAEFNRQWALAGHWILLSTPSKLE